MKDYETCQCLRHRLGTLPSREISAFPNVSPFELFLSLPLALARVPYCHHYALLIVCHSPQSILLLLPSDMQGRLGVSADRSELGYRHPALATGCLQERHVRMGRNAKFGHGGGVVSGSKAILGGCCSRVSTGLNAKDGFILPCTRSWFRGCLLGVRFRRHVLLL
jgi:hypothetical protein